MPAKSRRKRGKNLPPSRKVKTAASSSAIAGKQKTPVVESNTAPETPVVTRKIPASPVQTRSATYPFIKSELGTIGIFAVVILVILGILAAVM